MRSAGSYDVTLYLSDATHSRVCSLTAPLTRTREIGYIGIQRGPNQKATRGNRKTLCRLWIRLASRD